MFINIRFYACIWLIAQSICRYFGESIDIKDVGLVKRYCNNMCDVRSSSFTANAYVLTMCIICIYCQVCKYPDKTRHRKNRLSSIEHVSSQTAILQHQAMDDDGDGYPRRQNNHQVASNTDWMANRSNGSEQLGATKRSSFAFNDRDGGTKKMKPDIGLPTKLSKSFVTVCMDGSLIFEHLNKMESHKRVFVSVIS
jgi:hypothetical protein